MLFIPFAYIAAIRRGIFDTSDRINDYEAFRNYRNENTKTFNQWVAHLNISTNKYKDVNKEIFY